MSFFKPSRFKDFFAHLSVMVMILFCLLLLIFKHWLPNMTRHGESIVLMDLKGFTPEEWKAELSKRNLRFEINKDSGYSPHYPPLAVLRQIPEPNSKVKEGRKIYLTLNVSKPPLIKMPKLKDISLKAAQMLIKSYNLKLGEITFVPDPIAFGTIHQALYQGKEITEGDLIAKGSLIDLVAGDGYGNKQFKSPKLIGLPIEEAKAVILGSGLKIGNQSYTPESNAVLKTQNREGDMVSYHKKILPGTIQKQVPPEGTPLEIGDFIDIWIYAQDSSTSDN